METNETYYLLRGYHQQLKRDFVSIDGDDVPGLRDYQAAQSALVEPETAQEKAARESDLTRFLACMTSFEQEESPAETSDTRVSHDLFQCEVRERQAQAQREVRETLRLFGGLALILGFLAGIGLALSVGYNLLGVADGPPWALR